MTNQVKIPKKVSLKNAGYDECWLQDRICENPSILGLGDLVTVSREKKQSSGGRLDILLEDPGESSRYEVEVMLGKTDPEHIIRSIEYWDLEKRRYPQHDHSSVLIAESFDRRYFNVLYVLSLNIPMIAIQVELLDVDGQHILNFTKILKVYEGPTSAEADELASSASEASWRENSAWTLDAARELLRCLTTLDGTLSLNFTQTYISVAKNNRKNKPLYWFSKKAEPKSYIGFREKDDEKVEAIQAIFDQHNLSYRHKRSDNIFVLTLDKKYLTQQEAIFKEIHKIRFPNNSGCINEDSSE